MTDLKTILREMRYEFTDDYDIGARIESKKDWDRLNKFITQQFTELINEKDKEIDEAKQCCPGCENPNCLNNVN